MMRNLDSGRRNLHAVADPGGAAPSPAEALAEQFSEGARLEAQRVDDADEADTAAEWTKRAEHLEGEIGKAYGEIERLHAAANRLAGRLLVARIRAREWGDPL